MTGQFILAGVTETAICSLLISEPALVAEVPAPVDGATCCDFRAHVSVLGSSGEDVGFQLQFPFSLHSKLLPRVSNCAAHMSANLLHSSLYTN